LQRHANGNSGRPQSQQKLGMGNVIALHASASIDCNLKPGMSENFNIISPKLCLRQLKCMSM
jgi:hypothetical protein